MDTEFTNHIHNNKFDPAIRASLTIAKKTLNRYYSLTDASETYCIAMSEYLSLNYVLYQTLILVLHPRRKLYYFKKAGWEAEWIRNSEGILRDEFDRSYLDLAVDDADKLDVSGDFGANSKVRVNLFA